MAEVITYDITDLEAPYISVIRKYVETYNEFEKIVRKDIDNGFSVFQDILDYIPQLEQWKKQEVVFKDLIKTKLSEDLKYNASKETIEKIYNCLQPMFDKQQYKKNFAFLFGEFTSSLQEIEKKIQKENYLSLYENIFDNLYSIMKIASVYNTILDEQIKPHLNTRAPLHYNDLKILSNILDLVQAEKFTELVTETFKNYKQYPTAKDNQIIAYIVREINKIEQSINKIKNSNIDKPDEIVDINNDYKPAIKISQIKNNNNEQKRNDNKLPTNNVKKKITFNKIIENDKKNKELNKININNKRSIKNVNHNKNQHIESTNRLLTAGANIVFDGKIKLNNGGKLKQTNRQEYKIKEQAYDRYNKLNFDDYLKDFEQRYGTKDVNKTNNKGNSK